MQPSTTTDTPWVTAYANDPTTAIFVALSPWMNAPPVIGLRVAFELLARIGNFQAQAAYQTANDVRNPDSPVGFGNTKATQGYEDPSGVQDVATAFAGKNYYRLGYLCTNTSGTSLSFARLAATILTVFR